MFATRFSRDKQCKIFPMITLLHRSTTRAALRPFSLVRIYQGSLDPRLGTELDLVKDRLRV
jgi:hypothetical protein